MLIEGIQVPQIFYGTAWKEDRTKNLVTLALEQGFRGIDTANQRKHYNEAAVGEAIDEFINRSSISRKDLFIQTKFTQLPGQDHRLPYDPHSSLPDQVEQSFSSSLGHLGIKTIDSYILHGPSTRNLITEDDWAIWRTMEDIYESGRARILGVSNFSLEQLQELCQKARILPHFVQNRCYAQKGWDSKIRSFCTAHNIVYQGFSLLTANRQLFEHPKLKEIALRWNRDISQIIFRFALDIGIIPLTGPRKTEHMQMDLDVFDFRLDIDDTEVIKLITKN